MNADLVEAELELLVDVGPVGAHGGQAQAQAPPVLRLFRGGLLHLGRGGGVVEKKEGEE